MELVEGETLRELLPSGRCRSRSSSDRRSDCAGARARARGRDRPSGPQARERDGHEGRAREDPGLRAGEADGGRVGQRRGLAAADGHRHEPGRRDGDGRVHVAGAGAGHAVDYRSDQFALGSILYEMATGRRAFQKKTAVDTLAAILNEEPESIASAAPQTPAPLRWIVERCLDKEPDGRYASTTDLARELAGLRDHLSEASGIAAVEPGTPRRLSSKQVVGISLAALALLGVGYLVANMRSRPLNRLRFQKVTFQRGTVQRARFAPDSQTVVYSMSTVGDDTRLPELYTSRVGSLDARPLGLPAADILSISSSGQLAISLAPLDDPRIFGTGTLAEASLSGGVPRQLLENVRGADWSPDGKELAVTREVAGKPHLEFPIGTVLHRGSGGLLSPRVSPDGTTVAFLETDTGKPNRLRLVDRKGQVRTLLERGEGYVAWSPHGDEVWWRRTRPAATSPRVPRSMRSISKATIE